MRGSKSQYRDIEKKAGFVVPLEGTRIQHNTYFMVSSLIDLHDFTRNLVAFFQYPYFLYVHQRVAFQTMSPIWEGGGLMGLRHFQTLSPIWEGGGLMGLRHSTRHTLLFTFCRHRQKT
jgi:hypothetical protein